MAHFNSSWLPLCSLSASSSCSAPQPLHGGSYLTCNALPSPLGTCSQLENPDYHVPMEGRACTASSCPAHPCGSSSWLRQTALLTEDLGHNSCKITWPLIPKEPKINPPSKSSGHLKCFQPHQGSPRRSESKSITKKHQDGAWGQHQRDPSVAWTQAGIRTNTDPPNSSLSPQKGPDPKSSPSTAPAPQGDGTLVTALQPRAIGN